MRWRRRSWLFSPAEPLSPLDPPLPTQKINPLTSLKQVDVQSLLKFLVEKLQDGRIPCPDRTEL